MAVLWMGAIIALAVVLSLWPLWSRAPGRGMRRRAANVAGYRSRIAEIEAEVASGTVAAEVAQRLREETAARLLADAEADPAAEPAQPAERRSWRMLVAGAALIAAVSVVGYYLDDSHEVASWIAEAGTDPEAAQRLAVDDMVRRLELRLQREPEDAQGWAMLGRSYFVLGRYAESAAAYERANRLVSAAPIPDWLADEAEARVLLGDHQMQGLPRQLFERALALEPGQPKALWYAGLAAAQAGEYGVAVERWLALRQTELPDEFRTVLDRHLQELSQLAGRELPQASPPADTVRLTLDIDVAPELAGEIGASDVLFVVARRPDAPGPPLAVRRLSASELPLRITLDDDNAMAPGVKLSMADRWEVIARVSRAGTAQAQSGDLEGRMTVGRDDARQPVPLRIGRRIP
ncbi:MAG: c-type cytochrome biogenesis protein CcmI [Gammaproteobacteria bacterium]